MAEELSVKGMCPTVESDEVVSPQWEDDRSEYVCPQCGIGFGDDPEAARRAAHNHFVSA